MTDKEDEEGLSDIDEEVALSLAAAAALAVDNARLHERSSELSLLADRERIGRDLHNTVIQRIFAIGMAMHGTARLASTPEMLAAQPEIANRLHRHIDDLDAMIREIRSVILEIDAARPVGSSLRRNVLDLGRHDASPPGCAER